MRIIFNEIKKVFSFKMIVLIMFISLIMYYLSISFDFKYFPNGRPEGDYYKISIQMIKDYGTSMDKKEFLNFKELYIKQTEQANKYFQARPEAVAAGITTYDKYNNLATEGDENLLNIYNKLHSKVMFEDNVDIFWELTTREQLISDYERIEEIVNTNPSRLNKNEIKRYNETIKNGSITSILPGGVFKNYNRLIQSYAVLIVLSIIFMVSPFYIKDSINKVNYLQYTSKTGRKIYKTKLVTALLSSFIIISVHLACFFMLYSHNKVGMFFNSNINSIFNGTLSWYNINFIQYIALTVVGIYVLGFAVTLIVTFISRIAPNYITLIGMQVPLTFIFITITYLIMEEITIRRFPKYSHPVAYSILVIIGLVLMIFRWKKEKVVDILN